VFAPIFINEKFGEDTLICDSEAFKYYFNTSKGLFNAEDIKEKITVGNSKSMTAAKFGRLKCLITHADSSG
jgi:hypothetical protein